MSKTMSGADYKAFMNSDWDTLFGLTEAWVESAEVMVDGVDEPEDITTIPDTAKVVIYGGCILAKEDVDMSFEQAFTRWKKAQTLTTLVVQVPNERVQEFLLALKGLHGKVVGK